jgi:NADPH-dependent curcumin reductase CurA
MSDVNRQWVLARRPEGMVSESDFELREVPKPQPNEGEALVRNLFLSFDPAMRGWMDDRESYLPPVGIGEPMRASAVAQVIESRSPDLSVGDFVQGMFGWQDYATPRAGGLVSRIPAGIPLTWPLGVLGGTGITAYFGMLDVGRPRAGETVVVSGAAGATGCVAAQIARIEGCRVVGIAGGGEKCAWLTGEAGLDAAIDYKSEDVGARLGALCPEGIDVYFDNVGGEILDAALARLALRGRVVLCGGISGYNEKQPPPGPHNYLNLIIQRGRMEGFLLLDYVARFGEAVQKLAGWVREGRIVFQEDVQEGFENIPRTFLRLFEGRNLGKQLLKIADPPLGAAETSS